MTIGIAPPGRGTTTEPNRELSAGSAVRSRLADTLRELGPIAVAVSGGVDSMTLAVVAHRVAPGTRMLHASSAAVPVEATERVRARAALEGWDLEVIDAGEFGNEAYRANPVDRCFHCKTQLYATIRSRTALPIVSGANLSDLGEYRPGLDAARDHGVRHPYVEAGIDKAGVRAIARELGLDDVAELPASPCLSSRVETGIRIEPRMLRFVHAVETLVAAELAPKTVRCRVRGEGVVVELDAEHLAIVESRVDGEALRQRIAEHALAPAGSRVRFEVYRNGSAFLHG